MLEETIDSKLAFIQGKYKNLSSQVKSVSPVSN